MKNSIEEFLEELTVTTSYPEKGVVEYYNESNIFIKRTYHNNGRNSFFPSGETITEYYIDGVFVKAICESIIVYFDIATDKYEQGSYYRIKDIESGKILFHYYGGIVSETEYVSGVSKLHE